MARRGGVSLARPPRGAPGYADGGGARYGAVVAAVVVTLVHVSQVKAHLNGVRVPGLLRFTTLVAKVFGVTMVVSTGLPLGREGPMVHAGAG